MVLPHAYKKNTTTTGYKFVGPPPQAGVVAPQPQTAVAAKGPARARLSNIPPQTAAILQHCSIHGARPSNIAALQLDAPRLPKEQPFGKNSRSHMDSSWTHRSPYGLPMNRMQPPPQTAVAADEQQQTAVAASLTMSEHMSRTDRSHRRVLSLLKSGVVAPQHSDDDDSSNESTRQNNGRLVLSLLNSDDQDNPPIQIEFRFISGEEACSPMKLTFDPELSCGHL